MTSIQKRKRFYVVTNLLCNVVFRKMLSQDNRIKVYRFNNARQQSTLNTGYIPPCNFIRTGNCIKWSMLWKYTRLTIHEKLFFHKHLHYKPVNCFHFVFPSIRSVFCFLRLFPLLLEAYHWKWGMMSVI